MYLPGSTRILLALAAILCFAACSAPKPTQNQLHVTLIADGTRLPITTESPNATVRDILRQANITLGELDRVRPSENMLISDGMTITVTRIIQRTETQTQTVPFTQQIVRDATIPAGQSRVIQAGRNGTLVLTYRLTFEDGVQTERIETNRHMVEPPVVEMVLVGIENAFSAVPFTGTIVYLANNNAFVMRQATSNRRALTMSGDLDGRVLALSPDGKWLLFTRALTETAEGNPLNTLWVVNTVLANATPRPLRTPGVIFAGWSPDGRTIAYSTATMSGTPPGWRAANDLWLAEFGEGSLYNPVQILAPSTSRPFGWWGANYEWSPNGKFIAIGSTDGIDVVDLAAGKPITLTRFAAYNTFSNWAWTPGVTWTADSNFVISVIHSPSPAGGALETSPVFDVWALAVNGSFNARLAGETGMWAAPRVGAGRIVFGRAQAPYASADSRYDLFKMDRDGSNRARLFPPEGSPGLPGQPDFVFSPDGDQILVAYQRDLYIVNVSSGAVQQLTTDGNISSPRWSR